MAHPLVTIITPSYQRADFIGGAIDSVDAQTHANIEHIVIDGGSSDGTVDLLRAHAEAGRFDYVSEPDCGMYDAINKGLRRARGEIIGYINTDDRYFPWSVKTAVDFLEAHPDVDLVYGDTLVNDRRHGIRYVNVMPTFSATWLRCGGILPQPTVFFRRRVFERIGPFQKDVKYLADCEYWLRASAAGHRIAKVHEVQAVEINHSGTIRETLAQAVDEEKQRLIDIHASTFGRHPAVATVVRRVKYVEKELLALRLITGGALAGENWSAFLASHDVTVDLAAYFGEKLRRRNRAVWSIEPKHG